MKKTLALYTDEKGKFHSLNVSDIYDTMIEEIGQDVMTAGIMQAILDKCVPDNCGLAHYGYEESCLAHMIQAANFGIDDNDIEPRVVIVDEPAQYNDEAYRAFDYLELKRHGWKEENTGGNCMVMFKDFMCTDGKLRMVGVDGENTYGCIYPFDYHTYHSEDTSELSDDVNGTNENELLHQFQRDEIEVAAMWYAGYFGIDL